MQRRMNPGFRGGGGGVVVKGGGVMLKEAMVRSLQNGSLALSGRGLEQVPEGFDKLDALEYDNKTWWQECEVTKLDLSHNKLRVLPDNLSELPLLGDLQAVNVMENALVELPPSLFKLPSLTRLLASANNIASVPDTLTTCLQLKELDLSLNKQLTRLPDALGNLHGLTTLRVAKCGLVELPPSIGGCTGLQSINVSGNQLQTLPDSFVLLKNLQAADLSCNRITGFPSFPPSSPLTTLDLHQNRISGVPLVALQQLKELTVSYNMLSGIELETPRLATLDIRDNKLQSIAFAVGLQGLVHLNISNNDITMLPAELGSSGLTTLNLEGNPLKSIRRDVLMKGTAEILKYLKSRQAEAPRGEAEVVKETVANVNFSKGCVDLSKKSHVTGLLTAIPDTVFEDPMNVNILKCNNQGLTHLPREIGYLTSLSVIEICGNKLQGLPDEVLRLPLSQVTLRKNQLREFPGVLCSIPTLRYLDLSLNQIASIPSLPPQLDTLVLSDNWLTEMPQVPPTLTTLQLASNRITVIPSTLPALLPKITTLDLSNNDLTTVPAEVGTMVTLRSLSLQGNPLKAIRRTILDKGTETILAYLRDKLAAPPPHQQPARPAASGRNIRSF